MCVCRRYTECSETAWVEGEVVIFTASLTMLDFEDHPPQNVVQFLVIIQVVFSCRTSKFSERYCVSVEDVVPLLLC